MRELDISNSILQGVRLLNFVALDFETANHNPNSACSLGLVVVKDGRVEESKSWLVQPPNLYFYRPFVELHGITPQQVSNSPRFGELWPEIVPYISNSVVVAHNASFDMRVLRAALDTYQLPQPMFNYLCTVAIARRVWPHLANHKLDTVAGHVGMLFKHHDAFEDAHACAAIAIQACKAAGAKDLLDLASLIKCKPKSFSSARADKCVS